MYTAGDLVSTVRGRRLCYELAQRSARGDEVRWAMFHQAHLVHEERGDLGRSVSYVVATNQDGPAPELPPARALSEVLTEVAPDVTVSAIDLLAALSDTVTSAMGWQPPHAEDVVLAHHAVRAALAPIADVVVGDPRARWWSTPLDRDSQVRTRFEPATVAGLPSGYTVGGTASRTRNAPPRSTAPATRRPRWAACGG